MTSAHTLGTSDYSDLVSILINVSPVFLTLIILSFLFIVYKMINKFFITEPMNEAQVTKEINQQTIAYAVFMSSIAGFMTDMYFGLWTSIFVACCCLYVIYLLIRFLSPKN